MVNFSRNAVVTICVMCAFCVVCLIFSYKTNISIMKQSLSGYYNKINNNYNNNRNCETSSPRIDSDITCTNTDVVRPDTTANDTFDFKRAMAELNDAKVSQDDPRLIYLIRKYYLVPPATQPYNLEFPDAFDMSIGQASFVDNRLKFLECGFFVECGAHDGEYGTNTLFFERHRKWSGLLVEADPGTFAKLKSKNRKAYLFNGCLNTEPYPSMRTFRKANNMGRIAEGDPDSNKRLVNVQCFPLYSILLAIGQERVDFFSLDVEGDEMGVLGTIPWEKVDIRMMTVEFVHGEGGDLALKKYVGGLGYDALLKMSHYSGRANDVIFKKKGLK